jgi:hypothetical protein
MIKPFVTFQNLVWQMKQCPDIMWQIVDDGDTLTVFIAN